MREVQLRSAPVAFRLLARAPVEWALFSTALLQQDPEPIAGLT